ncbi:MAG TPA: TolC family protein, partial [Desulfobacteraceae bacterium]|nr:TolC family protein [Desulfobacteraceae bacterium]
VIPTERETTSSPPETTKNTTAGQLELTVSDAILMAVSNNLSLEVERFNPPIRATYEEQEKSVFDPVFEGAISTEKTEEPQPAGSDITKFHEGSISLKKYFPTGTAAAVGVSGEKSDSDWFTPRYDARTRLGLTFTQALMRGYGTEANLARLKQSRLETQISSYELRGFAEHLVAEVEQAYWDYALALRKIEIVEESLKVAEQQLAETKEMIIVGAMAEAEMAAVQAEVAEQKQQIIDAKSAKEMAKLRLLQLVNPSGLDHWSREIEPIHPPELPKVTIEGIDQHLAVAMKMRPEINQARLSFQKGEIEIVRTKNGLLPVMDLFVTLGKSGYAESFARSLNDMTGHGYDVGLGIKVQYPLFNRDAAARHRRAGLELEQSGKALDNLSQLIEMDVRKAHIEVERTREQIAASSATREFQEEKLRIETEKFRVGRSTNFLVAQAQRDLLVSRINEVEAVVDYLKALVDFYRLEGSLLERRGIGAPGREVSTKF